MLLRDLGIDVMVVVGPSHALQDGQDFIEISADGLMTSECFPLVSRYYFKSFLFFHWLHLIQERAFSRMSFKVIVYLIDNPGDCGFKNWSC